VDREALFTGKTDHLSRSLATPPSAELHIQFLGDGYFGDSIPPSTLAKIVDLGLSLGIECFIEPQRRSDE
jgi:hypothetical protein